ncbi:sensor histidine kinase [Spirosoma koreense]
MNDSFLLLAVISTVVFLLLAFFVVSFSLLFQRRQQQNLREKLELKAAYEEELLKAQLEVQDQTMKHLGEELHDNIGQLLAVTKLYLVSLEDLTQQGEAFELAQNTTGVVDRIIQDVRALTKSLDSNFLQEFGLVDTLAVDIDRIQKAGRVSIELSTNGAIVSLGTRREIVIYRIIQEMLSNALKHSRAKHIQVDLDYQPTLVSLRFQDDGVGFNYEAKINGNLSQSGAGLRNIERRAKLIGGSCSFQSAPGKGTTVQILLPVP